MINALNLGVISQSQVDMLGQRKIASPHQIGARNVFCWLTLSNCYHQKMLIHKKSSFQRLCRCLLTTSDHVIDFFTEIDDQEYYMSIISSQSRHPFGIDPYLVKNERSVCRDAMYLFLPTIFPFFFNQFLKVKKLAPFHPTYTSFFFYLPSSLFLILSFVT